MWPFPLCSFCFENLLCPYIPKHVRFELPYQLNETFLFIVLPLLTKMWKIFTILYILVLSQEITFMWHFPSCSFWFENVLFPYISMSDLNYRISWMKPFCSSCCRSLFTKIWKIAENTHHKGKYYCMYDVLFDWFGFDQTS